MRALLMALLLLGCATSASDQPDFSWVRGCWTSGEVTERWEDRADGGIGADVAIEGVLCGAHDGIWFGACRLEIKPDAKHGWVYSYEMRDDFQGYRLIGWTDRSLTFHYLGRREPPFVGLGPYTSHREWTAAASFAASGC